MLLEWPPGPMGPSKHSRRQTGDQGRTAVDAPLVVDAVLGRRG